MTPMADSRQANSATSCGRGGEKLTPKAVGLPSGRRRRTPGLRREEVAELAGIGVDWYIRLEQGRIRQPFRYDGRCAGACVAAEQSRTPHLSGADAKCRPAPLRARDRSAGDPARWSRASTSRPMSPAGAGTFWPGTRRPTTSSRSAGWPEADRNSLLSVLTNPATRRAVRRGMGG